MAAPDEKHTMDLGRKQTQISLDEMSRDEPITPSPLRKGSNKMTPFLDNNEVINLDQNDEVNTLVTSTERSSYDGTDTEMMPDELKIDNGTLHSEVNNEMEQNEAGNGMVLNKIGNGTEHNEISSGMNHNEIESGMVHNEIGSGKVHNEIGSGIEHNEIRIGKVHNDIGNGLVHNQVGNEMITNEMEQEALKLQSMAQPTTGNEMMTNNSEAISIDRQVKPPWKGVMVPCAQLKQYLDSLPSFNRKTMLRKGREVHKIYVDMTKGECFLDDQFAYTEFGKLVLTNGSIRAGRAKNAKQIVVARETLYCSGTGSCKRACGGYGVCAVGCDKTKMRGHRCGYRVKLTQRLGYVNFWFVECLGTHDQLFAKDKDIVESNLKMKIPFTPNFAIDLTNTPGTSNKQKRRSPANTSKRFSKSASPGNGNVPLTVSENSSLNTPVNYHYVLDDEPMGSSPSASNSGEATPVKLPETSHMPSEIYSNNISSQEEMYQKHVAEAAINAIKCHGAFAMPPLPVEESQQPQDLSAKATFSSPLLINIKQEPLDSPMYMLQNNSSSQMVQGQSHSPSVVQSHNLSSPVIQGQGHSPVMTQGHLQDRPLMKMQATQETLGQVHNRIMERAKSRKSSRTLHIPRENSMETKFSNKNYVPTSNHLHIPVVPPVANLNIPNVPVSSSNSNVNIDFKRFQTLNKILQSEAFQAAKQQLENSWNQSQSQARYQHQTSALNLTKKEPEVGPQLDHTQLLEEWRKGGQLQQFQQFHVKKESLPNGHADDTDSIMSEESLTKNEKDLLCRVHQLEAHVKQLQNIVIKREGDGAKTGKRAKAPREFDFTKYNTRHVALKIAYLGCDYHGFAVQEDNAKTIEEVLFECLKKTRLVESRETSNYHRCGRTDKGVSAFGQVISIDLRTNLTSGIGVKVREGGSAHERQGDKTREIRYVHILNKVLPPEIRVLAWAPVDPDFSARFSCKKRTYKYLFPKGNLDIKLMDEAAKKLIGEHDYRNLCKMDVANGVTNFTRKILSAEINMTDEKENGYTMCELTIVGSSFLWHQIRCIVGVLCLIGQGKENPQIIDELLDIEKNPRKPQYAMASEIPLVLFDSEFGDEFEWIYEADCHEDNIRTLQEMWSQHAVKGAILKRMLDDLDKAKVETECDIAPWSDLSPPILRQSDWLLQDNKSKTYKPLLDRPKCESLEDRVEFYAKKRKLNSGEAEPTVSTSEAD